MSDDFAEQIAAARPPPAAGTAGQGSGEPAARASAWKWLGGLVLLGAAGAGGFELWLAHKHSSAAVPKQQAEALANTPKVSGDAVEFPPALIQAFGVQAQKVEQRTLVPRLRLVGRADFDPARVAAVGTRTKGLIKKLERYEGDHVEPGDLLATVESTELAQIQAELQAASARVDAAAANAERERRLLQENLTTARESEQARAELAAAKAERAAAEQHVKVLMRGESGQKPGEYLLKSPMAGVVVERHVSLGQTVDDHILAFRIADLTHLWVELAASERHLPTLKVGTTVYVTPTAQPDLKLEGKITYLGDTIDPLTGTGLVRVEVQCQERSLRPGQSVAAFVEVQASQRQVTAIPREAVTWIDGKTSVFVQETPTKLRMVQVEVGDDDGQWLEVRSGLKPGQSVVVQGLFAVKSELYR